MTNIAIPTYLSIDLEYKLAGVGERLGAFVLDFVFKYAYFFVVSMMFASFNSNLFNILFLYLPVLTYSLLTEWLLKGQTFGKKILKLRTISSDGEAASVYQIMTRWFFNMVDMWSFILLSIVNPLLAGMVLLGPIVGGILIIVSPRNQRLGDMAASTLVIKTEQNDISLDDTIYKYANESNDTYVPHYPQVMRLSDKDVTKIQRITDKADLHQNQELMNKLAEHLKKILHIETREDAFTFLKKLLEDYNYLAKQG